MKYVAITFDDGRSDNYLLAKEIMDSCQFRGTVYVTTGFIDGTWKEKDVLKSPSRPLTADEIKKLHEAGWEIGLHGDRHEMQTADMQTALRKLGDWEIENRFWGVSAPNSNGEEAEIAALLAGEAGAEITYVRRGRKCDTKKLKNRALYGAYSVFQSKWAYRHFNAENAFLLESMEISNVPSIVVKGKDRPEWIIDFIRWIPDGSAAVLMLHSILPADHAACGKDPWSWESGRFEKLCQELKFLTTKGEVEVLPLMELVKGRGRNDKSRKQSYSLEY